MLLGNYLHLHYYDKIRVKLALNLSGRNRNASHIISKYMNYWRDKIDVLFTQSPLGETALETVTGIFHTTMQAFVNVQKMELQSVITYVVCRT
jgi:hypothetical protein